MKTKSLNESTLRKADEKVSPGNIYFHVYNRGVNGQYIFTSDDNYSFLIRRMNEYQSQFPITVVAYCLMPTHYHFLIEADNRVHVSRFIQKLFNSYSQAFNQQQNRTGTLFEARAKFKVIDSDEYAIELCSYIHLNPIKAGLAKKPEQWKYSNYVEWINPSNLVSRFFDSPKQYEDYVLSSLAKG